MIAIAAVVVDGVNKFSTSKTERMAESETYGCEGRGYVLAQLQALEKLAVMWLKA